jgi:hypothetical protein
MAVEDELLDARAWIRRPTVQTISAQTFAAVILEMLQHAMCCVWEVMSSLEMDHLSAARFWSPTKTTRSSNCPAFRRLQLQCPKDLDQNNLRHPTSAAEQLSLCIEACWMQPLSVWEC